MILIGYEPENHGFTWIYPPPITNMAGWKIPEPNGGGTSGMILISGWWFEPSPLKNMSSSVGMMMKFPYYCGQS